MSDGMAISREPVAWVPRDPSLDGVADAYGCFMSEESMSPAYDRGNLVLVNPQAAVVSGDDIVLVREGKGGERFVLIRRLVRQTDYGWVVRQFNPPQTSWLARRKWPSAHLIIGKRNRVP